MPREEKPALAPHLPSPSFLESSSLPCLAAPVQFLAPRGRGQHESWLCRAEAVTRQSRPPCQCLGFASQWAPGPGRAGWVLSQASFLGHPHPSHPHFEVTGSPSLGLSRGGCASSLMRELGLCPPPACLLGHLPRPAKCTPEDPEAPTPPTRVPPPGP